MDAMNRSDKVKWALMLDAVAAAVTAQAAAVRAELTADAAADFAEQGTATTWRLPDDLATVSMRVSRSAVVVSEPQVWLKWVAARYPDEVVRSVRTSWQAAFLKDRVFVEHDPDDSNLTVMVDPSTGERIPGLEFRRGGEPLGISIRAGDEAKRVFALAAEQVVGRLILEAGPSVPVVLGAGP
jgi:hypothetical protein